MRQLGTGLLTGPVAILGAGTMGTGIAQVVAASERPVVVYDPYPEALHRASQALSHRLGQAVQRGRLPQAEADGLLSRITTTDDMASCAGAVLVVEAAPESLELKRGLLSQVEAVVDADCVLATNTSTLSVSAIAAGLRNPERAAGLHFFNPAPRMPLVEVVRGAATAPRVVDGLVALAKAWGKVPIVTADTPGFIVNRVARPYYGESLRLLGEGVAGVEVIDRLCRDAGFPMGPFELMDLIGIDVNLAAAESVFEGFFGEPRFRPHPIQRAMVNAGRLGRKSGRGYYEYEVH